MGFDVSNLGSYIDNNGTKYVMASIADAPTAKALIAGGNVQYGVKGQAAILKLNSGVAPYKITGSCGRIGGTAVALSDVVITVNQIRDEANLCPEALHNTFYAKAVQAGLNDSEEQLMGDFVAALMENRALKIAEFNEKVLWQGDTTLTGSTYLNIINGINKQVTTSVSTSGATVVEKLQNFFLACDPVVRTQADFTIAVGQDVYSEYLIALSNKNLYHPTEDKTLYGTVAKLFPTSGLNGTRKVIGIRFDNIQLGLDGKNDGEKASIKYSIETNQIYQDFAYALGVAVVYPTESVYTTV